MSSAALEDQYVAEPAKSIKILPFGKKANRFIARTPAQDARLNILVGSVRSAKTWAVLTKIIALCYYEVAGQKIITGASKQAIYRNVLTDLFDVVGEGNYTYNRQSGDLNLFGSKWVVCGASDEGSERSIRGMTVGVAVCDEIITMPKSFCNQLMARMSPDGARLYATTNPDSPYHWFKVEVLDSPDLTRGIGKDLWWETWTMDDNPNLSEQFKAFTKRKYTGVFFDRFVRGLFVLASGSIYKDVLSEENYYTDATRPFALRTSGFERWISIDYGTRNPCVFIDIYDDGKTVWFDNSYYWSSEKESRQKTDAEYADDLIKFVNCEQRVWPGIIIDPSAASFRTELLQRGFFVIDADNEVDEGIRMFSTMLARNLVKINKDHTKDGIQEMETTSWDSKKAENGKEQPIKAHDHYPDAGRYYIKTRIHDWRLAA